MITEVSMLRCFFCEDRQEGRVYHFCYPETPLQCTRGTNKISRCRASFSTEVQKLAIAPRRVSPIHVARYVVCSSCVQCSLRVRIFLTRKLISSLLYPTFRTVPYYWTPMLTVTG